MRRYGYTVGPNGRPIHELPTMEDLEQEEINMSSSALRAAAYHLAEYCDRERNEHMLCIKEERGDPRQCLPEGKAITNCALELFSKIKSQCASEFTNYFNCFESKAGGWNEPRHCRDAQYPFDICMLDKLGIERPGLGEIGQRRVLDVKRKPFDFEALRLKTKPKANPVVQMDENYKLDPGRAKSPFAT